MIYTHVKNKRFGPLNNCYSTYFGLVFWAVWCQFNIYLISFCYFHLNQVESSFLLTFNDFSVCGQHSIIVNALSEQNYSFVGYCQTPIICQNWELALLLRGNNNKNNPHNKNIYQGVVLGLWNFVSSWIWRNKCVTTFPPLHSLSFTHHPSSFNLHPSVFIL